MGMSTSFNSFTRTKRAKRRNAQWNTQRATIPPPTNAPHAICEAVIDSTVEPIHPPATKTSVVMMVVATFVRAFGQSTMLPPHPQGSVPSTVGALGHLAFPRVDAHMGDRSIECLADDLPDRTPTRECVETNAQDERARQAHAEDWVVGRAASTRHLVNRIARRHAGVKDPNTSTSRNDRSAT